MYVLLITGPILYLFCFFPEALVWQQQNHFEGCFTFHEIGRGEGKNIAMGFLPLECIFGGPHQDPPPPLSPISRHISFPFFFHFLCGRRKERNEAGKRARGGGRERRRGGRDITSTRGRKKWLVAEAEAALISRRICMLEGRMRTEAESAPHHTGNVGDNRSMILFTLNFLWRHSYVHLVQ